jgi:hypothetical protein
MEQVRQGSVCWKAARMYSYRLTASELGDIFRMGYNSPRKCWTKKVRKPRDSDMEKNAFVLAARKWGQKYESVARATFEDHFGVRVQHDLGIKSYKDQKDERGSYLFGGSPDGVFIDKDGKKKLLEIKCPYKFSNQVLKEPAEWKSKPVLQNQIKKGYMLQEIALMEIFDCESVVHFQYLPITKEWVAYEFPRQHKLFEETIFPQIVRFVESVDLKQEYKLPKTTYKEMFAFLEKIPVTLLYMNKLITPTS